MISLNADNLLLRGCSLRNTDYIYGITVFQGHDTKIMRNSAQAKYKFSQLELHTNTSILMILLTQIVLASIGAIFGASWVTKYQDATSYLGTTDVPESEKHGFGYYLVQQIGTWILIFTNFVPISLMVSLEIVKFWQAGFMAKDHQMFDQEQDMEMRAQSSNLNEELGQVEYVFSDKTGTLTCNIMEFKKFTAGTKFYGTGLKPSEKQLPNVCFHDPQFLKDLETNTEGLLRVMMFLGVCHTIIIDGKKGT